MNWFLWAPALALLVLLAVVLPIALRRSHLNARRGRLF